MWRSVHTSRVVLRRGPLTESLFATTTAPMSREGLCLRAISSSDVRSKRCSFAGRTRNRSMLRSLSSSANGGSGKRDDDNDEGEEWIPPIGGGADSDSNSKSSDSRSMLANSERIETILDVARQVKEQERLDRAIQETEEEAEALLQLTEEEQRTLSDEEILERLDAVLKREEELEEELVRRELEREEARTQREGVPSEQQQQQQQQQGTPDWLQARRARQGSGGQNSSAGAPVVVPVIHHTPLTADEIQRLLEAHGGTNIAVVPDDPEAPRMGGADGMVFCTAGGSTSGSGSFVDSRTTPYMISSLARVLIDHMKDRGLDEDGTAPGAKRNTKNRSATAAAPYGSSASATESWNIVDCGNYVVHILEESTRRDLRLEELWSGFDPLWRLDILDEEAVEEYCQHNPVPEGYDGTTGARGSVHEYDGGNESPAFDDVVLKRLERNQFGFTRRHKPVVPQAIKNKNRRAGRKHRRQQKERAYFGDE